MLVWKDKTAQFYDCDIVAIGDALPGVKLKVDYTIKIGGHFNSAGSDLWLAYERDLSKKRPPKQLDDKAADQEFIDELNAMMGLNRKPEVEV